MEVSLNDCVVDPAKEDWASQDDATVWHSAQAGIPEAVRELSVRRKTLAAQALVKAK